MNTAISKIIEGILERKMKIKVIDRLSKWTKKENISCGMRITQKQLNSTSLINVIFDTDCVGPNFLILLYNCLKIFMFVSENVSIMEKFKPQLI